MKPLAVVGDVLLDIDVEGTVERMCPDAPAPVLAVSGERIRPGGAGLAAVLLAGRGIPVRLVTALGADPDAQRLRALLRGSVDLVTGPAVGDTVVKCRLRTEGRSLLRVDRGTARAAPGFGVAVAAELDAALTGVGAVLVSDYGRAVTADPVVRAAVARAVARRVAVVWDPHPRGAEPVRGVTVVTPNLAEARAAAGEVPDALAAAAVLVERWHAGSVAVTLGAGGAVVWRRDGSCSAVPTQPVTAGDTCGAGDLFAGAVAEALAHGAHVDDAVAAAVTAATEFCAHGGAGGVHRDGARWVSAFAARVAHPAHAP